MVYCGWDTNEGLGLHTDVLSGVREAVRFLTFNQEPTSAIVTMMQTKIHISLASLK